MWKKIGLLTFLLGLSLHSNAKGFQNPNHCIVYRNGYIIEDIIFKSKQTVKGEKFSIIGKTEYYYDSLFLKKNPYFTKKKISRTIEPFYRIKNDSIKIFSEISSSLYDLNKNPIFSKETFFSVGYLSRDTIQVRSSPYAEDYKQFTDSFTLVRRITQRDTLLLNRLMEYVEYESDYKTNYQEQISSILRNDALNSLEVTFKKYFSPIVYIDSIKKDTLIIVFKNESDNILFKYRPQYTTYSVPERLNPKEQSDSIKLVASVLHKYSYVGDKTINDIKYSWSNEQEWVPSSYTQRTFDGDTVETIFSKYNSETKKWILKRKKISQRNNDSTKVVLKINYKEDKSIKYVRKTTITLDILNKSRYKLVEKLDTASGEWIISRADTLYRTDEATISYTTNYNPDKTIKSKTRRIQPFNDESLPSHKLYISEMYDPKTKKWVETRGWYETSNQPVDK